MVVCFSVAQLTKVVPSCLLMKLLLKLKRPRLIAWRGNEIYGRCDFSPGFSKLILNLLFSSQEMTALQRGNTIDIDTRSAELWKNVHTLSYAISALNVLFDMVCSFILFFCCTFSPCTSDETVLP